MTADLLRAAASKMRERAQAATAGPWEFRPRRGFELMNDSPATIGFTDTAGYFVMLREGTWATEGDMGYLASWHPAVALAVADLLDWVVAGVEAIEGISRLTGNEPTRSEMFGDCEQRALAVAHAYLGTDPASEGGQS